MTVRNVVKFSNVLQLRCQTEIREALEATARHDGTKPSDLVRRFILEGLRARGVDPLGIQRPNPNATPESSYGRGEAS
jgi:hypothetical protein